MSIRNKDKSRPIEYTKDGLIARNFQCTKCLSWNHELLIVDENTELCWRCAGRKFEGKKFVKRRMRVVLGEGD